MWLVDLLKILALGPIYLTFLAICLASGGYLFFAKQPRNHSIQNLAWFGVVIGAIGSVIGWVWSQDVKVVLQINTAIPGSTVEVIVNGSLRKSSASGTVTLLLKPGTHFIEILAPCQIVQSGYSKLELRPLIPPGAFNYSLQRYPNNIVPTSEVRKIADIIQKGGSVNLCDGIYQISDTILLSKSTSIIGKGMTRTKFEKNTEGSIFRLEGDQSNQYRLVGFASQHTGSIPSRVIEMLSGEAKFYSISVSGGKTGLYIGQDSRVALIEDSQFYKNRQGIAVESGDVTIRRSKVWANNGGGDGRGIVFLGQARGRVFASEVFNHWSGSTSKGLGTGVAILANSSVDLESNLISANWQGILVSNNASARISTVEFTNNKAAVIINSANPVVELAENKCKGNTNDFLYSRKSAFKDWQRVGKCRSSMIR